MLSSRRYWPLWQLIVARVREFVREPEALFWVYGFPIVMTLALGIAFRNQPVEQQVAVDVVSGPAAQATNDALAATPARFKPEIHSDDQARLHLRTGKCDIVVIASSEGESPRPTYQYLYDPTRQASVLARNAVDDALQRAAGRRDAAEVKLTEIKEPGSRYIDFLVPGLLGLSLMGGGLWGVGFVTVDMRIRKLLKRFLATPMKRSHFLGGIMLSRMLFVFPEVAVLLVFARYVFDVRMYGSLFSVAVLVVLGAFMFSGIGLLVASRAKTIEMVSGLMNLVMLPMWIFSGVFFSSDRFPAAVQPFVKALPLTPLIDALRAVMLEGASLSSQAARLGIMGAWAVITFVLALRWFRWM